MNGKKLYIVTGIIFVSVLGTFLHFAYNLSGNNFFVGLFAPINESIWEHTKLIYFPMLIYGLFFNKLQKDNDADIIYAGTILGAFTGILFIIVAFYTYSGILGYHRAFVDISIFYIAVILAFYVTYKTWQSPKTENLTILLILLSIFMTGVYFAFTLRPLEIPLFVNP